MDIGLLAKALDELGELIRGDGVVLRLTRVDTHVPLVEVELDVSAAECGECVLPPEVLSAMVDAGLKQRVPGDYRVEIVDRRRPQPNVDGPTERRPAGARWLVIVDPAAESAAGDDDPGADVGELAGKTVGVRVDVLWRSWDWVVEEWTTLLEQQGASVVTWRRAQGLAGSAGQDHRDSYAHFLATVDVAIVGLANCGSCTSWTIKDAVAALATGAPTIAVATRQFEQLAHTLAGLYGRSGLRLQVLPYPLDIRPEDEVRAIARDAFPALLVELGVRSRAEV